MSEPNYKTLFPFGNANVKTETAGATKTIEVFDNLTIVDFGELAADMALSVDAHAETKTGAILVLKAKSDSTARNITAGTGIVGGVAGTISKTKTGTFIYDGTNFVQIALVQLD